MNRTEVGILAATFKKAEPHPPRPLPPERDWPYWHRCQWCDDLAVLLPIGEWNDTFQRMRGVCTCGVYYTAWRYVGVVVYHSAEVQEWPGKVPPWVLERIREWKEKHAHWDQHEDWSGRYDAGAA